mmetsp:Transcript_27751/g.58382  ORF Transcript_27751/g.58382 Transcript_27751/m.58382 type:complete len:329 (+) Transcript_27751:195-1181(+)
MACEVDNGDERVAGKYCSTYAPYTSASKVLPSYWVDRYEREAAKQWDLFYMRNEDRFFKDRHYLQAEWSELKPSEAPTPASGQAAETTTGLEASENAGESEFGEQLRLEEMESEFARRGDGATGRLVLLEAGCGVGNTAFPLLRAHPKLFVYAFDFSSTAVRIVQAHPLHAEGRIRAAVGDLTSGSLPDAISDCQADIATLMFVLSAISVAQMPAALRTVHAGVRDGGIVLFRDYAHGDGAQQRFISRGARQLDDQGRFFVRQDGTRAYFFDEPTLIALFDAAGFDCLECACRLRQTVNHQKGVAMERRFLAARFQKRGSETAELAIK